MAQGIDLTPQEPPTSLELVLWAMYETGSLEEAVIPFLARAELSTHPGPSAVLADDMLGRVEYNYPRREFKLDGEIISPRQLAVPPQFADKVVWRAHALSAELMRRAERELLAMVDIRLAGNRSGATGELRAPRAPARREEGAGVVPE